MTEPPATSNKDQYLYLEIASGGTVQKKFYHKQGAGQPWKEYTNPDKTPAINLTVNGVLGMTISDNKANEKFRVSIRTEDTTAYVHEPKLGKYRAYSYSGSFNIQEFIKPGPYGSETLKDVGTPTNSIKEVIVYCSLDYNTPLLIYYGDGPGSKGQPNPHHWFKNTGNARWTTAAGTLTAGVEPPTTSPTQTGTQNAQAVRKVLEETNCLVNGVVQINVQQTDGPTYCQGTCNPPRIKVTSDKAGENPYKSLLKGLGGYKVFEHTPNGTSTLTISAFKKGTDKYLHGIPTGGATSSYITGVTRVVVFLKNDNPCLIYYHVPGATNHQHKWYKYNGSTGWTNAATAHRGQLQDKSPEQVAKEGNTLQDVLNRITTGDDTGATTPDSNVSLDSTEQLNLPGGTPTDQYNRYYGMVLWTIIWTHSIHSTTLSISLMLISRVCDSPNGSPTRLPRRSHYSRLIPSC